MSNEKIKLLAVVGPTASGKTALAVELAKKFNGEVVSCDSMQIYKGMEVATAAPTEEEQSDVKHYMVGCVDPTEQFSVSRYCEMAHHCIEDICIKGKLPILCGGTGLYFSSLVDDLEFVDAPSDEKLRSKLYERAEKEGGERLLCELGQIDPETAERLHPNNISRIVRALEIYMVSGITLSEQNKRSRNKESRYDMLAFGINYANREDLYRRIDKRVDIMLQKGLIAEARMAYNINGKTSVQAIGHKELWKYFEGEQSFDEAVDLLKRQTRRYAKRQLTWFRRDDRIIWLDASDNPDSCVFAEKAVGFIEPWLRGEHKNE